jgi:AcrR family transcriptional regulator
VAKRIGRRPGASGTREQIAEVARRQFADFGYARTTYRGIAREAEVDPALVQHFFGTKNQLFVAVVTLPFDPAAVMPALLGGDPAELGERFVGFVLSMLEQPVAREVLTGLVRAAVTEPEAAVMVRDLITRQVFAPMVDALGMDDAPLRASMLGAQVVGLVMARYVVAVEPLASAGPEQISAALAPVFQRLLAEPLH